MSIRTPHRNVDVRSNEVIETRPFLRAVGPHLLSTIWVSMLLSMLFRDVHEYLREGFIAELALEGTVNGTEVTDTTLLVSGFVLQLPLAMVVLAKVLPRRSNRIANVVVAVVMALGVLGTWPKDADDLVFGIAQLFALSIIVVICGRWRADRDQPLRAQQ